uniref:EB domain-containing protein n=1 Tax=Ascaris lumbricoides TaxID=6252 RepID=A0A0M3IB05_ASCLU
KIPSINAQCPSGSVALLHNSECVTNVQCQNQAPGYICYNGVCCSDGTDTISTVPYNGYCTMNNQCRVEHTQCLNNHCVCDNEYAYSGQACVPVIKNCASNEVNVRGSCYRKVSYGFQCEHTEQCTYEGGICNDGLCRCANGFLFDNTKCLPQVTTATCRQSNAKVEITNGVVKNCYNEPCAVGYFCEFNANFNNGQYICCGSDANDIYATCRQSNAKVEITNGVVKNCYNEPCAVGYFCEFNANFNNGQYICCGSDANDIYGIIRMLPGTDKPLECSTANSCTYVNTPNCVMSPRYGYKVCCSTMIC